MAAASYLVGLAAVLASGIAMYFLMDALLVSLAERRRASSTRRRVAQAPIEGSVASAGPLGAVVEHGFIARILAETEPGQNLSSMIRSAGLSQRPAELIRRVLLADIGVFVAVTLITRSPLPGIVLAVGALIFGYFWVQGAAESRLEQMRIQLPDAFTLVGNSLASGLSLVQALGYAAAETDAPLGPQLYGLVNDVAAGMSLPDSLERFRASVPLRELQTISTAMEIQHKVGGNIREMLEQATASVRQTLELRMSLRAQTAQGRMSAKVVGLLPLGLVALMSLMMKGYLNTFLSTGVGILMFTIAILADIVGFVLIRKILDIEI